MKTMGDLVKMMVPILKAEYEFSQILGEILKETNKQNGPPPTYYIGDDDADPSSPQQGPQKAFWATTPVAGIIIDQAGGVELDGPDFGVALGVGGTPVAVINKSTANGAQVQTANWSIGVGPDQLALAGAGSATANGPVVDQNPDNVHMAVGQTHNNPGKHTIYTAAGTGAAPGDGLPGDCAREVAQYYDQLDAQYPADTFPMGPSVKQGVADLVKQISAKTGTFAIIGYSQGAIVTCKLWRDEILNPQGQLHDRKDDIFAHVSFGNPLRCPGIANGNGLAGLPVPGELDNLETGGIAGPDDLTPWQTPPWHKDFAHEGDLYAHCPTGPDPWSNESDVGMMETSVYKLVQGEIAGPDSILYEIGNILTNPIGNLVPLFEAMINGMQFLASGCAPHNYDGECKDAAIQYLKDIGAATPVKI